MLLNLDRLTLIFFGVAFFWLVILSALFYNFFNHYRRLTKGIIKKDLKSVLDDLLKNLDQETERIDTLFKEIKKLEKENAYNVQKIGLVRFNPFAETGGDQSFCLAVLDANDNGFVISSLHSRETTRLYAKPIKKGKATGYQLSDEEKQAIKKAKKIK